MRKKEERKKERKKMTKSDFSPRHVHRLPRTLRYVCECFCELLGSIILSVCLVWGVVASLAVFLLVYQCSMVKSKFPWPSLNRERYRVL